MSKKKWIGAVCILLLLICDTAVANDADSVKNGDESKNAAIKRIDYLNSSINAVLSDNPKMGDSLALVMLQVAEFSRDRELMCRAYTSLARQYINYADYRNNLSLGLQYAHKCLELAKASGMDQFTISSYLSLARISRKKSDNQKALEYNNLALSLAVNYGNDSITSVCYSGLSNTWMNMNNKLSSFQSRLSAREFAEKSKSIDRIMSTSLELANFYASINEHEKAKDLFYHVMQLSRREKEWEFLMLAQRSLGDIYSTTGQKALGMEFYNQALKIADSVGRGGYKINIYFDLVNYFLNHETAENALAYFESQTEITRFLKASGQAYEIDKIKGFYFSEKKNYDSADYYFQRVINSAGGEVNKGNNFYFYNYLAGMYARRNMNEKRLFYLLRCRVISDSTGDIEMKRDVSLALDSFYLSTGDYKEANRYYTQYNLYKDSLRTLSEQKELLGLEIENENKRKAKQEETALLEKQKRNNIQYLGITAAIATVFILLVLSGAFKISIPVIKALGFFSFIFLFEFIILLADNQIHEWTHGEPWKVMGFKIILVAMLLPLHHWLEHKVIHYLLTHNMLPKKVFSLASLRKSKTTLSQEDI